MSLIYTEADFNGYIDDRYRRYSFFENRGIEFNQQWSSYKNNPLLIAGCGWGFLVQELMENHGFTDVWGCDASEYAVNVAAPRELPETYASRILLGDIKKSEDMLSVANQSGLRGNNPRFKAILTEDVLPCLAESEITTALSILRSHSQAMAHIITPQIQGGDKQPDGSVVYPGGAQMPGFTWLTHEQWLDTVGPGEPILFTDTKEMSNV